ncbi:hypothetical protein J8J17_23080, partial [Mycobacterium tuberculosis]|nr:hypothetical protein [Mycobacterium tuberculosis]
GGYIGGQWFGMAKFNFMFGLVQLCASLSSAFSVTALQYALAQMEWRTLFTYVGASGVILTVLAYIYLRNPAPVEQTADSIGGFFKDVIA